MPSCPIWINYKSTRNIEQFKIKDLKKNKFVPFSRYVKIEGNILNVFHQDDFIVNGLTI